MYLPTILAFCDNVFTNSVGIFFTEPCVDWGCIRDAPRGYFIKVLTNSITTYPEGNLVGLWGVLCECTYWVLVGVNYVYITKDIRPHSPGLCGVN